MNQAIVSGNLCRDPEVRTAPSGETCAMFTLGVRRDFKNAQGAYESDFVNVVTWRKTAEFVSKYFKKGAKVAAIGRIQTRAYEKDGAKKYITEIVADKVESLQPLKNDDASTPAPPPGPSGFVEIEDDKLPF